MTLLKLKLLWLLLVLLLPPWTAAEVTVINMDQLAADTAGLERRNNTVWKKRQFILKGFF